jgi:hypothetical protein
MTSQQKADAIDRAAELEIESTRPHNWQPMIGHTPSSTSTKSDDTTERDRRALEKIFGDDPTKKEDKD